MKAMQIKVMHILNYVSNLKSSRNSYWPFITHIIDSFSVTLCDFRTLYRNSWTLSC